MYSLIGLAGKDRFCYSFLSRYLDKTQLLNHYEFDELVSGFNYCLFQD